MINRSIENAQRKVEGHNFDIRKNLLEYDDVSMISGRCLSTTPGAMDHDITETGEGLREEVVYDLVAQHILPQSLIEQWDTGGLELALQSEFGSAQALSQWLQEDQDLDEEGLAAGACANCPST